MKYNKRFTEAMGYFLCFFILIFLIYSYMTFDGVTEEIVDEVVTEAPKGIVETVKANITAMLKVTKGFREYLILFAMFFGACVVCSATDRFPFVGIVVSFVPLYYTFSLFAQGLLVFVPMLFLPLSLAFFVGEIVATGMWSCELTKRMEERGESKSLGESLGALRLKLDKFFGFDQVEGYEKRKNKRKNK